MPIALARQNAETVMDGITEKCQEMDVQIIKGIFRALLWGYCFKREIWSSRGTWVRIKIILGARDYLQLQSEFIREKRDFSEFCRPLRACREKHSVATQRLEDHSLQCGLQRAEPHVLLKQLCLSVCLGSQFAPVKPFPHLLSAAKAEAQREVKQTIKHVGNP